MKFEEDWTAGGAKFQSLVVDQVQDLRGDQIPKTSGDPQEHVDVMWNYYQIQLDKESTAGPVHRKHVLGSYIPY
jgi:hypothetical protein